ncbi:pilus assembly protein CpaE [Melghirimyces thermohalophilus]|uniref:Pilus assembly protein CpaE n=1 Tax=Melghirimyces thermohalophilus TaxID=1236220 RepID=A0A1G6RWC6_9BACL|nr:AAA family ATPase [Melghirimyces thermohalophilus]SDD08743.1 pilus assembly protein CpaE [Melghirimyces thermohalophilus]
MRNKEKLLIVSEDPSQAEDIVEQIGSLYPQHHHIEPDEVRKEIVRLQPDIVLLCERKDGSGVQLLPYLSKEVPDAITIYLTNRRDPVRTRDVNRAGAFDILFLPDEINALEDVLNRAVKALQTKLDSRDEVEVNFAWAQGKVIAFYSGKGGCGQSLVASTLAQTIGLDSSSSVLLVDLNMQYGGIETILNVDNPRNLYDLVPVINELNDNHIRSVTSVEEYSQIEVLSSPVDAETAENITEEHVERLIRTARLYYDYILIDLPTEMTPMTYTVLEEADHISYVMVPDMLSLRVLSNVLDLFSKLNIDPTDRLHLLLNRVSRDTELMPKDVNRHFSFPVVASFREDYKRIQQLLNKGKLIRKSRRERALPNFARDVQKLASWLLSRQGNNQSA